MQDILGILLMFAGAASGLLVQDPVVCRFTESNQCYVALGQRLHLPMPLEEKLELKIIDMTSTSHLIIRYRKIQSNPPKPNPPRWQFVNESKTMILTSAERSDSGTYTLDTYDANGNSKANYTLQLNIEAEVSSVKLSFSCLSPGVMKVYCSADGDNLRFNWTPDLNTLPQLENGNSALILNKDHHGNVTCRVENHVSYNNNTTELHPCPGLLVQDPVVCRFTESNQCYVALGQRLHLPMPLEEKLELNIIDKTSTSRLILRYRKIQSNPPKPNPPRWQFVNESKTMILTSAERNDSGTYTLVTFDANGNKKDNYTLQLNIEAEVSSVKLSFSCLSPGVMKVYCSADGDNLRFNWTSDLNTLPQLENGNSALILNKDHHGNVTCRVENHVSYNNNTTELHPCPESTTSASFLAQFTNGKVPADGPTTAVVTSTLSNDGFMVFVYVWLCEVIILLSLLVGAFCIHTRIYRKQKITENQEAL
ncbi:uncharacterized protein LOC113527856 isoform X2 [Pangasianodon hypophthalmus]|uniref:uncharacterized protein LOC113527856 isoform X2 n=1 Tax=Pangasianodon hypophthalmus TaxID=310915 RepID=UPI0023071CB2|nr:uncharacterized protein LOC113527856 isoform X2 [Pangasianodon hypophthalmus]